MRLWLSTVISLALFSQPVLSNQLSGSRKTLLNNNAEVSDENTSDSSQEQSSQVNTNNNNNSNNHNNDNVDTPIYAPPTDQNSNKDRQNVNPQLQNDQALNSNTVLEKYVLENQDAELFDLTGQKDRAIGYTILKNGRSIFKISRSRSKKTEINAGPSSALPPSSSSDSQFKILYWVDMTHKSKYKIKGNFLFLLQASVVDEAEYSCLYEILGSSIGENVISKKLTVVRVPTLEIHTRENLVYNKKDPKVAKCSANKAKPGALIEWSFGSNKRPAGWKQGDLMSYNNGVDEYSSRDIFFQVTPQMNNTEITCRVSQHPALELDNQFKREGSIKTLTLDIDYPPQFTKINATSTTILKCWSDANPKAGYNWWVGKNMIVSDKDEINFANRTHILESNSTVSCQATNHLGTDSAFSNPNKQFQIRAEYERQISESGMDTTTIIFVIIAVLMVLLVLCGVGFFFNNKKSKRPEQENGGYTQGETTDEEKVGLKGPHSSADGQQQAVLANIAKADLNSQIVVSPSLGVGAGSAVQQNNMNTFDRRMHEHTQQGANNLEKGTYDSTQVQAGYNVYTPSQQDSSFVAMPPQESQTQSQSPGPVQTPAAQTSNMDEAIYDQPVDDTDLDKLYYDDPSTRPK